MDVSQMNLTELNIYCCSENECNGYLSGTVEGTVYTGPTKSLPMARDKDESISASSKYSVTLVLVLCGINSVVFYNKFVISYIVFYLKNLRV